MLQILFAVPLVTPTLSLFSADMAPNRKTGEQLSSSLSLYSEFELVEVSASQNGEETPDDMLPEMTRTMSRNVTLGFTDSIKGAKEGAATSFERRYTEASGTSSFDMEMVQEGESMEPMSESDEFESDVVGGTVVFQSDGDQWAASAGEECEVDDDDLADLMVDYSFAFLLPGEDVGKGDQWAVEVEHLGFLMDPIGDLPREDLGDDEDMGAPDTEPEFSGSILAVHGGEREVDGRSLVVITLEFDCESEHSYDVDVSEFEGGDEEFFGPSSLSVEMGEVIDGSGELLFDPRLGLIEQLNLELSIERTKVDNMSFDVPEMGEFEVSQTEVDSGTIEVSLQSSIEP